jgi:hypothetical protein
MGPKMEPMSRPNDGKVLWLTATPVAQPWVDERNVDSCVTRCPVRFVACESGGQAFCLALHTALGRLGHRCGYTVALRRGNGKPVRLTCSFGTEEASDPFPNRTVRAWHPVLLDYEARDPDFWLLCHRHVRHIPPLTSTEAGIT